LACYFDLRYEWWSKQKGWFIALAPNAGGGGIAISYCPHCGANLRASNSRSASVKPRING
jgi:hypothetical protein